MSYTPRKSYIGFEPPMFGPHLVRAMRAGAVVFEEVLDACELAIAIDATESKRAGRPRRFLPIEVEVDVERPIFCVSGMEIEAGRPGRARLYPIHRRRLRNARRRAARRIAEASRGE